MSRAGNSNLNTDTPQSLQRTSVSLDFNPLAQPLRIEIVESRAQRNDFYRVKRDRYAHDPAAVIPLQSMEWLQLDPQRHPFYQHARRRVWVAYLGSRPVGRIAAIVDDLHNEHYQDRVGFFGFFESPPVVAIATALLQAAREWLIAEGCDTIRGPVNPSMKSEFGVMLAGWDFSPFIMMAHTMPYYDALLLTQGLIPVRRFHSFLYVPAEDNHDALQRFAKLGESCDRVRQRFPELEVRSATQETLGPMLREINRIGNIIRSRGWGFVPLTEAELDFNVKQLRRIINPETVIGCWMGDRMVGYNVLIPNINWAIKRCVGRWDWMRWPQLAFWKRRIPEGRLIAIGVDPTIRAKGISALVTKSMTDLWHKFTRWEFGWIDEENLASTDTLQRALPLRRYKTYQVYEQKLKNE